MRLRFRLTRSPFIACLMAACLPPTAQAAQVIVTITGTVQSGNDASAVFGTLGDLAGQPFILIFTYDDTEGTSSVGMCPGTGEVYASQIESMSASSPGTAVSQIGKNGGQFAFGDGKMGEIPNTSYALRYAQTSCFSCSSAGFSGNRRMLAKSAPRRIRR